MIDAALWLANLRTGIVNEYHVIYRPECLLIDSIPIEVNTYAPKPSGLFKDGSMALLHSKPG